MIAESSTVILARVSSKAQEDEGYSLDAQLKLLRDYCAKNSLTIIKEFKIAETASKEYQRKVFHEMLSYIGKEAIFHLAVEKTDRFTRNFRDAVAIDEWLEQDDRRQLHAVKENLTLHKNAKSDVKFMWNIHISVAKKYADNLREESMKGWAEKLAQGWSPAQPPPGYILATENGKRIHIPDPLTKDLIVRAYKKYLEPGMTIKGMVKELKDMGIKSSRGHYYCKSSVQTILSNTYYIGIISFNGKAYPGSQEQIIPRDLFERVQEKMHAGRPKVSVRHHSALQSLIRCEDCGSVVTWQLQKGHYYGVCRRLTPECKLGKMLREDRIEEMVVAEMKKLVCPSPAIIDWVIEEINAQHGQIVEEKENIASNAQEELKRVSRMDDNLYDDKLSGLISNERYEVKHEQFMIEKASIEDQLSKIDSEINERMEQRLSILELTQKAAEIYSRKAPEQKRLIISKLFSSLTIKSGQLSVKYSKFVLAISNRVQKTTNLLEV